MEDLKNLKEGDVLRYVRHPIKEDWKIGFFPIHGSKTPLDVKLNSEFIFSSYRDPSNKNYIRGKFKNTTNYSGCYFPVACFEKVEEVEEELTHLYKIGQRVEMIEMGGIKIPGLRYNRNAEKGEKGIITNILPHNKKVIYVEIQLEIDNKFTIRYIDLDLLKNNNSYKFKILEEEEVFIGIPDKWAIKITLENRERVGKWFNDCFEKFNNKTTTIYLDLSDSIKTNTNLYLQYPEIKQGNSISGIPVDRRILSDEEFDSLILKNVEIKESIEELPKYVKCTNPGQTYSAHPKAKEFGCTNYINRKSCITNEVYKVLKKVEINPRKFVYILESYKKEHFILGIDGAIPTTEREYENQLKPEKHISFYVRYSPEFTEDLFNKLMEWCKNNITIGKIRGYKDNYEGLKTYKYFIFDNYTLREETFSIENYEQNSYGVDNNNQETKTEFSIKEVKELIGYKEPEVDYTGRWLKALVENPQSISILKKGDYIRVKSKSDVHDNGRYIIDNIYNNLKYYASLTPIHINTTWEIMPEGFIPPESIDKSDYSHLKPGMWVRLNEPWNPSTYRLIESIDIPKDRINYYECIDSSKYLKKKPLSYCMDLSRMQPVLFSEVEKYLPKEERETNTHFWRYIDKESCSSFNNSKIYYCFNPKKIETAANFIDEEGTYNGFCGINHERFYPATIEEYLANPGTPKEKLPKEIQDKINSMEKPFEHLKVGDYVRVIANTAKELDPIKFPYTCNNMSTMKKGDVGIIIKVEGPMLYYKEFNWVCVNNSFLSISEMLLEKISEEEYLREKGILNRKNLKQGNFYVGEWKDELENGKVIVYMKYPSLNNFNPFLNLKKEFKRNICLTRSDVIFRYATEEEKFTLQQYMEPQDYFHSDFISPDPCWEDSSNSTEEKKYLIEPVHSVTINLRTKKKNNYLTI